MRLNVQVVKYEQSSNVYFYVGWCGFFESWGWGVSQTLDDVLEFVSNASYSNLSDIADEIQERGYAFECYECETHECEEHDSSEDVEDAKRELLQSLARRLDQFGLDDMLEELKSECELVGVNLKIKVPA